ncbi:18962_t:CDS:1, partial [Gigaspora rosea]
YHLLKTIYEKFIFYINELGSCLREQGDGEITSVDMLFKTNDFSRISEYCTQQIYNTMGEIEGK